MASWSETNAEIARRNHDIDAVRRERIRTVEAITNRPLIVYATDFTNLPKLQAASGEVTIDARDKISFDEVTRNLDGPNLDILIQSPGGYPEAAESIIELLRSKYSNIRFIVPDQAKSAATMMCCAADQVVVDHRSELGPIDPQMILVRGDGKQITAPAQAVTGQFEDAKKSLAEHPEHLPVWLPLLQSMAPSLLKQCEQADQLAVQLVKSWLKRFMLRESANQENQAAAIANFFSSSLIHLSHGRRIGIEQLRELNGFNIFDLRTDPDLQRAVWDLYLAISITFDNTAAFKIVENGRGDAYIRQVIVQQIQMPPAPTPPTRTGKKKGRHGR